MSVPFSYCRSLDHWLVGRSWDGESALTESSPRRCLFVCEGQSWDRWCGGTNMICRWYSMKYVEVICPRYHHVQGHFTLTDRPNVGRVAGPFTVGERRDLYACIDEGRVGQWSEVEVIHVA